MVADTALSYIQVEKPGLEEILLGELARLTPELLPGVDGMTTGQVLRDYGRWAQQGVVASHQRLASEYPDLSGQLSVFFVR